MSRLEAGALEAFIGAEIVEEAVARHGTEGMNGRAAATLDDRQWRVVPRAKGLRRGDNFIVTLAGKKLSP